MRYRRPKPVLIAQRMGDWTDTVKNIGGGIFNVFESGEQAKGAANVLAAQQQAMLAQQGGMFGGGGTSMGTLLMLGGAGLLVYLLLKKKKAS